MKEKIKPLVLSYSRFMESVYFPPPDKLGLNRVSVIPSKSRLHRSIYAKGVRASE